MNKRLIRLILALFLMASALPFTACMSQPEEEATVPWNRPADYEGVPGMPNMPSYRD